MKTLAGVLLMLAGFCPSTRAQLNTGISKGIVVQFEWKNSGYAADSLNLKLRPARYIAEDGTAESIMLKVTGNRASIRLDHTTPVLLEFDNQRNYFLEPGDSIYLTIRGNEIEYSGRGWEKLGMHRHIQERFVPLKRRRADELINDFNEYQQWITVYDKQLKIVQEELAANRSRISVEAYDYYKIAYLTLIESARFKKVQALFTAQQRTKKVDPPLLSALFDSVRVLPQNKFLLSEEENYGVPGYYHSFLQLVLRQKAGFDPRAIESNDDYRVIEYYKLAHQYFKGHVLENYLAWLLTERALDEIGPGHAVDSLLTAYYKRTGRQVYKDYVKNYENDIISQRAVRAGALIPSLDLLSIPNTPYNRQFYEARIGVMYVTEQACKTCKRSEAVFNDLVSTFKSHGEIVFIHVIAVPNLAKDSIKEENGVLHYYTSRSDPENKLLWRFNVTSYPSLYLWNPYGRFIVDPVTIFDDTYARFTWHIKESLHLLPDGPYVSYTTGEKATAYYTKNSVLPPQAISPKTTKLLVATDIAGASFQLRLKSTLTKEPSVFAKPEKIFALSDIEGNFEAFRKLLQANGIMDQNYNWTFAKGHLVFAGDMFDRGFQVTECLWLIYSLEEKAKAAGGYVHFILGNHEIMNMQGDHSYAVLKYEFTAALLGKSIKELYDSNSELGRWLRTKNITEKIGDILFAHGGISPQVNNIPLTLEQINDLARPWYDSDTAYLSQLPHIRTLYHSYTSPFWYRHYYKEDHYSNTNRHFYYKATPGQLDSTFAKFKVKRVVTGHTIIADTISVHYGGKIINIDTKHAAGRSEALLVEGDKYFRVNQLGKKVLLFVDEKNKIR